MERAKLRVKGIIFDLDGTIVDSRGAYLKAARTAFAALGKRLADTRVAVGLPKRFEQDLPIDDLIDGLDLNKFREAYLKAYYEGTAKYAKPFPQVADTLEKLSQSAKLALTTRRHMSKKQIIQQLEEFGLAKYFRHIVTAMDTANPKPAPDALLKCAEHMHVKTCDCLVVGDSVVDIRAGKNAKMRTVAVLSGIFTREELHREKPDLILENIEKLLDFIE